MLFIQFLHTYEDDAGGIKITVCAMLDNQSTIVKLKITSGLQSLILLYLLSERGFIYCIQQQVFWTNLTQCNPQSVFFLSIYMAI